MSAWLLSITGIIVVGVLVELLLTDSVMSKFIRSIYAFFVLFVIVQPLPGFFGRQFDWNNQLEYDWALIGTINANSVIAAQTRVETALRHANISNVIVTVTNVRDVPQFRIENVYINAWNAQYTGQTENINLQARIISIATAVLNVSADQITVTI